MLLEAGLAVVLVAVITYMFTKSKKENIDDLRITDNRRPLGFFERHMASDETPGASIAHACIISSKRQLTSAQILKAAQKITDRHQLLRSRVERTSTNKAFFVAINNFSVPFVEVDSNSWQDVMEEKLLTTYNKSSGPLWCLSFLPQVHYKTESSSDVKDDDYPFQSAVVFGFDHVIIDGCSRTRLANEFLTFLDDVIKGVDTTVAPMEMRPAMEYYIADKINPDVFHKLLGFVVKILIHVPGMNKILSARFMKKNMYAEKFGLEEERNPDVAKKTCIIPTEFSREETSKLLSKCKEHGCTMYGVIQASALVALSKLFQGDQIIDDMTFDFACTVNVRPFIEGNPVPPDCLGTYFLPLMLSQTISATNKLDRDFWKLAAEATELIKKALNKGECFLWMKFMGIMFALKLKSGHRYPVLSSITNLGYCKFLERSDESEVKFRAMHSCMAEHHNGPIFSNRVITFNGQMFSTVCYYTNVTSRETAIEFADLVNKTLRAAMNE